MSESFFEDLDRIQDPGASPTPSASERHLRLLAELSREMSSVLELDEMVRLVLARLGEMVRAERSLLLLGAAGDPVRVFQALDRFGVPLARQDSEFRRDVVHEVLNAGAPRIAPGETSVIAVPLESARGRFGALYLERARTSPAFGSDDLLLTRLVGSQASQAIELLRLEEEKRRTERMRLENGWLRRLAQRQAEQARVVEQLNHQLEHRTAEVTETSQFLEGILESSTVHAIVALDLEGRVVQFNTGARLIYGWAPEDLIGSRLIEVLFDAKDIDASLLDEMMCTAQAESGGYHAEVQRRTKDGELVPVQVTMTAMRDAAGEVTGFLDVSRNVSQENRLRQQVLLSEKMAALGTLAAGVAHEFNNLLQGIIGFLGHALERDEATLTKKAMEVSLDAAERAAALTGRLQAFARPAVSGLAPGHLSEIADQALGLVERNLATEGIEVIKNYDPELAPALVDRSRLGQVILNLLTNARHSLAGRRERRITVTTAADGPDVLLRIADTGCGIPEAVQSRIFEPFFTTKGALGGQVHDGKVHGTGLGLAISSGIVTEHGGRLELESEEEVGTTFTLRLPATEGAAPAPADEETPGNLKRLGQTERPRRLLIVDDERAIRVFLSEALRARGHVVETAEDGQDALDRLAEEDFDVVVADFQMPRLDGAELFRRLEREREEGARPYRILITGRLEEEGPTTVAVEEVLRKPFGTAEIVAAVERATRRAAGGV